LSILPTGVFGKAGTTATGFGVVHLLIAPTNEISATAIAKRFPFFFGGKG